MVAHGDAGGSVVGEGLLGGVHLLERGGGGLLLLDQWAGWACDPGDLPQSLAPAEAERCQGAGLGEGRERGLGEVGTPREVVEIPERAPRGLRLDGLALLAVQAAHVAQAEPQGS